jgi:hypothetical protein
MLTFVAAARSIVKINQFEDNVCARFLSFRAKRISIAERMNLVYRNERNFKT